MRILHFQAKRLLSAYADGALDSTTTTHVAEHIKGCPACIRSLEEISESSEIIHAARTSASLDESRLREIVSRAMKSGSQKVLLKNFRLTPAIVAILVIGVLIAAIAVRNWYSLNSEEKRQSAIYLDLLVQEASYRGSEPVVERSPYQVVVGSLRSLEDSVGRSFAQPELPAGFHFRRGFVYKTEYGGSTGRVYATENGGGGILILFEQPRETEMAYAPRNPKDIRFLGKPCIEVLWPSLRLLSWVTGKERTMALTNLSIAELENAFRQYPGF